MRNLYISFPILYSHFSYFEMQSTYCASLYQHCETRGRAVHIVNLNPEAENFDYQVAMGNSNSSIAFSFYCKKCVRVLNVCRY